MLILFVSQSQCGCHGNTVPGMHTHRIKVLNGTDDDAVIFLVTDNFHLILFPSKQRLFNQNLVDRTRFQSQLCELFIFVNIVRNTASPARKGKRGTDNQRKADLFGSLHRFIHIVSILTFRKIHADFDHRLFKRLPVFTLLNRFGMRSQKFYTIQHPFFIHCHRNIQCSLSTHGRQDGIDFLFFDNLVNHIFMNRFNVRTVCKFRVCHNRCGIGVNQNNFVSQFFKCFCCLCSGIIKFTRLSDHNRT